MRVSTDFLGCIFCWHTKRIVTHWIQDIKSSQPPKSSHTVPNTVISNVTHVHFSAWIWEHLQAVELRFTEINIAVEHRSIIPCILPLGFDCSGVVFHHSVPHACTCTYGTRFANSGVFLNEPQQFTSFGGYVVFIAVQQKDCFSSELVSISHADLFSFDQPKLFQCTQVMANQLLAGFQTNRKLLLA